MKPHHRRGAGNTSGTPGTVVTLLVLAGSVAGCHQGVFAFWNPPPPPQTSSPVPVAASEAPPLEDPPLKLIRAADPEFKPTPRQTRMDILLRVLHVQVPRSGAGQVATLWNHVREDALSGATTLRLQHNGLRVGVGNERWWEAVRATLDAADDVRSLTLGPVRLPPNYPLALEMDERPHEQTLFYVADDGVVTGETWPQSRNVLRVSYDLNLEAPQCVRLTVVPEVRQRLDGWRWIRSEAGLLQLPNYNGRTFRAAAFEVDLDPGEFLLVAPGRQADLYGIVGGEFLTSKQDGRTFDSYVFLRADVNHVAHRN